MKSEPQTTAIQSSASAGWRPSGRFAWLIAFACLALPTRAHASLFHGETLDGIANVISWVAIIIAPIIGLTLFWLVHILPEKIAHKRKHPQTRLVQCLCLMSLVFGGILWPLAWILAYSKPVLHKLAYGTDVDESIGHHGAATKEETEIEKLRARVAELELQGGSKGAQS